MPLLDGKVWASLGVAVEAFNVGGWLTHGDYAMDDDVDFLAVVENRLYLAQVRNEDARLHSKGISSAWAPASQEPSHVGNAGVGVVSLKVRLLHCPVQDALR